MIRSRGAGWVEQPATPARASEAPISVRNWRRVTGSVHSEACSGNSRPSLSRNSGVSRSSSSPRQRARPPPAAFPSPSLALRACSVPSLALRASPGGRCGIASWSTDMLPPRRLRRLVLDLKGARGDFCVPLACASGLPVARRAAGEDARLADMVVPDELLAEGPLAERLARVVRLVGGLPGHVEDLVARPDEVLRPAVAVQAPLHQERVLLEDEVHLVDPPVAGGAADPLGHVDAVVEEDEARQVV